jgi:glycosyltransferase involved in cell wall biosynthesis
MRDANKVIYTSSYDRGLEHLLAVWPEVKAEVPEATLDIFYGWDLFSRFYGDNPERMSWKAKMDKLMEYDGITHHGRVSQPQILEEMKKAGIWAYPAHFGEISCISAMKAQACGAVPVVVAYAALQTTVAYGVKVDGDIYDRETKEAFKRELVALLKDHKRQEEIRKPMMKWAKENLSWAKVATQWSEVFKDANK